MGDTGSLTIGMIICFLSFKLAMMPVCAGTNVPNPLMLAFSPLLIPCLDVLRVYMGRVRRKKNPFLPDKTHIHHKLLAIGLSQHAAMITILTASILFTLCNILLSHYLNITFVLLADILAWTLINMWISKKRKALNMAPSHVIVKK